MTNVALSARTVLSLCSGYSGIGLGLRLADASFVEVCHVEREITAARILVARMQDGALDDAPIWSDLKTFAGKPWRGRIHTITAGYPCQPFSCAGKQLAAKDPRHLWPHVARIIREVQPAQVFLENVDAHLRLGFHEVASELERMGYRVACGLFSAEEVGAPHRRLRLFALAERTGGRRGVLRESPGIDGFTDGRGAELANGKTFGYVRHPGAGQRSRPGRIEYGRGNLANAERQVRGVESNASERQAQRGATSHWTGADVADTGDGLLPLKRRGSQGRTGIGSAGAHVFPPGPADLAAWSRLLLLCPDVEPAVCRNFDGAAARVDRGVSARVSRLRALGNGVVPLTAALAYSTLRNELDAGGLM